MMRAVLTFVASILWSVAASAQSTAVKPAPAGDALTPVCTGLLEQSGAVATGKDKLCACLVQGVTSQLTVEEMAAYADATLNSQAPPQAVMDKVMGIATRCLNGAR